MITRLTLPPRRFAAPASRFLTSIALLGGMLLLGACTGDGNTRQTSQWALARWEDQRLAPQDSLQAMISGTDAHIRLAAVRTAGLIGRNDVLPELVAALDDASLTVRTEAAWSLGLLKDPDAVPALEKAAADPRPALRMAALAALGQVENEGKALLTAASADDPAEAALAWDSLRNMASSVPESRLRQAILAGLTRPEADVRWRVLRCAELVPDSSLTSSLIPLARAAHPQVRVHAYRALGPLDNRRALAACREGFATHHTFGKRERPRVDIAGYRALGSLGHHALASDQEDPAPLAALLVTGAGNNDPHVAATALEAMARLVAEAPLPPEATTQESLLPVWRIRMARSARTHLDRPHPGVRAAAIRAYAALRGAGGINIITDQARDEDSPLVLAAAMEAVSLHHPAPVDRLLHCAEIIFPAGFGEDERPARCNGATRAAAYTGLARILKERPGVLPDSTTVARIESHLALGLGDEDFVVAATCAGLVGDFPSPGALAGLLALWHRATGPYRSDLQLGVLDGLTTMLDPEERSWTPADTLSTLVAGLLRQGFDSVDLRIRLKARQTALKTELLPAHLIPTAASLKATVPAIVRHAEQAPLHLPFAAPRVIGHTDKGDFVIRLDGKIAPNTCAMFLDLIERGFYEDLTFHRVVPDFVVQGGDPLGHGWGGPGYTIRSEWSRTPYTRARVGIAHSGKDTGGCQFFVTLSEQPHLNGRYTIFGEVVDGMEVIDRLEVDDRFRLEIATP